MKARVPALILSFMLLAWLSLGALEALAYRAPQFQPGSSEKEGEWLPPGPPEEETKNQIEGACGIAVSPASSTLYVSDYYHRAINAYGLNGLLQGSQVLAGGDPRTEINELDAVCGLAVDAAGNRYGSELHQAVLALPGEEVVDPGPSTGIAVDEAGNLYVDDRTYVAVYDAPVTPGEPAAEKIDLGPDGLVNAYGVAVDASGGRVYVADAATDTVKIFEPATEPIEPVKVIAGPAEAEFSSLKDAALTVDTSKGEGQGHLLVIDNTDPGAEMPRAAIYEFDAAGNYLDRLSSRQYGGISEPRTGPLFGEPSGLSVDPTDGDLYVTTGNSVRSNVLKYGPFESFAPPQVLAAQSQSRAAASATGVSALGTSLGASRRVVRRARASASVVVQRGPVRVKFDGKLTPHALPRHGTAPVGIAVDTRISGTKGGTPPQLRRIAIEINRNGHFSAKGLPVCEERAIQPSTTAGARAACGAALVGEGHFAANVKLPEQSPFPSSGKVLAFNGRLHGKPAILAHIYGTQPAPTSYVLPFSIRESRGTYGTVLETSLPNATGDWGYVTGLEMKLHRSFHYHGKKRSYLSAGCPAPAGFPGAAFPLARTSFAFAGGMTLVSTLNQSCRAKG
jgi:DNA-binding beta-propeller fold protein YncE